MTAETHSQLANFIWSICNLLRGPYKRNEYRKVILPLTVLRRFDCLLAPTKAQVLEGARRHQGQAGDASSAACSQKITGRPFYNLSKLDFAKLLDDPNQLAPNLNSYINGFSPNVRDDHGAVRLRPADRPHGREEPALRGHQGVRQRSTSRPDRVDNVQMGYVFEELIRIGAEQSNEEAGEHFTPREVIKLMVNLLLSPEKDLAPQPRRQDHLRPGLRHRRHALGGREIHPRPERRRPARCSSARTGTTRPGPSASPTCSSRARTPTTSSSATPSPRTASTATPTARRCTFDYMLANPPFGVEWKQQQRYIEQEHDTLGYQRPLRRRAAAHQRRLAPLPPAHALQDARAQGRRQPHRHRLQRLAALHRRRRQRREQHPPWIIENDWLEAIVALPDQLFYNTGISTYLWVLTNRKEARRKGKVQLIDARQFFVKMKKSLGNKRNKIGDPADKAKPGPDRRDHAHLRRLPATARRAPSPRRTRSPAASQRVRRQQDLRQRRLRLPQDHRRAPAAAELPGQRRTHRPARGRDRLQEPRHQHQEERGRPPAGNRGRPAAAGSRSANCSRAFAEATRREALQGPQGLPHRPAGRSTASAACA